MSSWGPVRDYRTGRDLGHKGNENIQTTFVLVHGGFGSPAELAPTVPFLKARGHPVINVDLPCERPDATLDDYANAVIQAMEGMAAQYQPWPGAGIPDLPHSYILCTEDQIIPPKRQRAFAAALGVVPTEIVPEHSVFSVQPR